MTTQFSSFDGVNLYADTGSGEVYQWTPLAVAGYGSDPASSLAAELGVSVSDMAGLSEALAQIDLAVTAQTLATRNDAAERLRTALNPTLKEDS